MTSLDFCISVSKSTSLYIFYVNLKAEPKAETKTKVKPQEKELTEKEKAQAALLVKLKETLDISKDQLVRKYGNYFIFIKFISIVKYLMANIEAYVYLHLFYI